MCLVKFKFKASINMPTCIKNLCENENSCGTGKHDCAHWYSKCNCDKYGLRPLNVHVRLQPAIDDCLYDKYCAMLKAYKERQQDAVIMSKPNFYIFIYSLLCSRLILMYFRTLYSLIRL